MPDTIELINVLRDNMKSLCLKTTIGIEME